MACNSKTTTVPSKNIFPDLNKEDVCIKYTHGGNDFYLVRLQKSNFINLRLFLPKNNEFDFSDLLRTEVERLTAKKGVIRLNSDVKFSYGGGHHFLTNQIVIFGGNNEYATLPFAYMAGDSKSGMVMTRGMIYPPYVSTTPGRIWINDHEIFP
jgi:hypothetical protein